MLCGPAGIAARGVEGTGSAGWVLHAVAGTHRDCGAEEEDERDAFVHVSASGRFRRRLEFPVGTVSFG